MDKARGVYYGKITNLDHQIGRLFGALQRAGHRNDTLTLYTSDHGEHLGDHGDFSKSTFLESSARVPLLIRLPGGWREGQPARVAALAQHADLLPTFCEAAGIAPPGDIDGSSLFPLLRSEPAGPARLVRGPDRNPRPAARPPPGPSPGRRPWRRWTGWSIPHPSTPAWSRRTGFVLTHSAVSTVIPGIRTVAQAEATCAVSELPPLGGDLLRKLRRHNWRRAFWYSGK